MKDSGYIASSKLIQYNVDLLAVYKLNDTVRSL